MQHHTFKRGSFTLLASAMAAAASGQAIAETAGKVSFVTGNVTATTPDGASRSLRRGDAINGGDRIETRGGRLQIRFTDGGFVALQPNTVFGVDQYLYANKAPEDTSLFFSLLRGGMRTITGAIGKVNKQSYKVRTPVATIGIRGTGYRAIADNDRTLVSVGHGFVNVENALGNITAGAGQNILATNDLAPGLSREAAGIPATGPEGDREDESSGEESTGSDTARFGEQITVAGDPLLLDRDANGNFILIDAVTLDDTDLITGAPRYSMITPQMSSAQTQRAATFSSQGGGLLTLGDMNENPLIPLFDSGTLQFHGVTTVGGISWGEYTNGAAGTNTINGLSNLSSNQYASYVVGATPSPDVVPSNVIARYSLIGGTTPRLNQTTGGTLNDFKIDVDFASSKLNVLLDLTMSGETFTAQGSGLFTSYLSQGLFDAYGLTTTSTGSSCASYCSTSINGFFGGTGAGDSVASGPFGSPGYSQLGVAYSMSIGLDSITGTAGLGLDSFTAYEFGSFAAPIYAEGSYPSFLHLNKNALFDANGGLNVLVDTIDSMTLFESGSLHYSGITRNGDLTWAEFTDGAAAIDYLAGGGASLIVSSTQFEPYIFGSQSTTIVGHGTSTYSLQGGTTPRLNQTSAATLNNFSITINFDLALMDLALGLTTGGLTANVSGTGMAVSDIFLGGAFLLRSSNPNQLTVSGSACSPSCSADISGFFAGDGGTQIGAAYAVNIGNGEIKGVAALGIGSLSSSSVLPNGQLYTMARTGGANPIEGDYFTGDPMSGALEAEFGSSGELLYAQSVYPLTQTQLGTHVPGSPAAPITNAATAVDIGTYKTLSWGRYTNGDVMVDGQTVTLSGPSSEHYVIGQETPSNMMSNLGYYGGTASYALVGHTAPTSANAVGTGMSATVSVNFSTSLMAIDMSVFMPTGTYSISGQDGSFSGTRFSFANMATTATGGLCASGCSTSVDGFFSGHQAQQIGMAYKINDFGNGTIKGAAVLSRGAITPPGGGI